MTTRSGRSSRSWRVTSEAERTLACVLEPQNFRFDVLEQRDDPRLVEASGSLGREAGDAR